MERKRGGTGKKKIQIQKIEEKDARNVCFSKRKAGIYSMSNSLATLCGAKVAVLIESPAGFPFAFGSPSVGHVVDRFLCGVVDENGTEVQRLLKIQEFNNSIMEVGLKIEEVVKKKKMLMSGIAKLCEDNEGVRRIENAEKLNFEELKKMIASLEKLKEVVKAKLLKDMAANSGNHAMLNLSGNGIGQAVSSAEPFTVMFRSEGPSGVKVSSSEMTMFPELGQRVNKDGSDKGKALDTSLNLFEYGSLGHLELLNPSITPNAIDEGPSEPQHAPGENTASSHALVELDMLVGGHAKPFTTMFKSSDEGPSGVKEVSSSAVTMFPELGQWVNEDGSDKALDTTLNLFEYGSLGCLELLNPSITPNAIDVGPSEPQHAPGENTASSHALVELDMLLGGHENFPVENEPK